MKFNYEFYNQKYKNGCNLRSNLRNLIGVLKSNFTRPGILNIENFSLSVLRKTGIVF